MNEQVLPNWLKGEHPLAFFGVFDGHGGNGAADFCAHQLPIILGEQMEISTSMENALHQAYLKTDAVFLEYAKENADYSGCTAVAAIVGEGKVFFIFILTYLTFEIRIEPQLKFVELSLHEKVRPD